MAEYYLRHQQFSIESETSSKFYGATASDDKQWQTMLAAYMIYLASSCLMFLSCQDAQENMLLTCDARVQDRDRFVYDHQLHRS